MKHRNRLNVVLLLTMLSSTTNLIARRSDNLLPDTAHWEKLIIGAPNRIGVALLRVEIEDQIEEHPKGVSLGELLYKIVSAYPGCREMLGRDNAR